MTGGTRRTAVLAGLGSWLPPNVVTNDMLAQRLDTSDAWIRSRTGIGQRHVVDPGMATADLAEEAGRRALKSGGDEGVTAVVLATTTPDRPCPATAPEVASRLGLGNVAAFDVNAVCSGFVYGLAVGAGLIAGGLAERMLVIGADTFSTILDPNDRTTSAIFGDGAGGAVLRAGSPDEPGALLGFDLGTDGDLADLIAVDAGGSRQRSTGLPPAIEDTYFHMRGKEVFLNAVERMGDSARSLLGRVGWELSDVDRVVGHQANIRILHALADHLEVPRERLVVNLERVGNTAAASIPLALADGVTAGELLPGHRVLLSAFGGGLAWGSVALTWPDIAVA